MENQIPLGSDIKVLIEMTAPGFSMANDDWEVTFKCGGKAVATRTKEECFQDYQGNWYATLRGADMKNGQLSIIFHALVPDDDWDDGLRNEYDKQDIAPVVKI